MYVFIARLISIRTRTAVTKLVKGRESGRVSLAQSDTYKFTQHTTCHRTHTLPLFLILRHQAPARKCPHSKRLPLTWTRIHTRRDGHVLQRPGSRNSKLAVLRIFAGQLLWYTRVQGGGTFPRPNALANQ